jgi:hypothetical protein
MAMEKSLENLKWKWPLPRQMQQKRIIDLKNWVEYTPLFNAQLYTSLNTTTKA